MKVSIVYWSGTGNTEAMANAVLEGAQTAGADVSMCTVEEATDAILDSDAILFGCPAMGAEELEPDVYEPFFASIESRLAGKKVGLFGSYEWADGEWMRLWQERTENDGATMIADGLIAFGYPNDDAIEACKNLGALAAK